MEIVCKTCGEDVEKLRIGGLIPAGNAADFLLESGGWTAEKRLAASFVRLRLKY
jgi:hypothetical protein